MSATTTRPALADLEGLERAAHEAEARVTTALAERHQSARWLPAAQAKLAEYLTAVDNGSRKRDAALEREMRANVTDLEAMRVAVEQRGQSTRYADRRAIARHADALDAAQDAAGVVVASIVEHRDELEEEMRARSLAARDRLLAAIDELSAAAGQWTATARDWRVFLARWNGPSPGEIPGMPLPGIAMEDIQLVAAQVRGGAKDPRGALPMPISLAPCDDPDDEATSPDGLRGWVSVPRVLSGRLGLLGA
jgi:hypothetical protein